MTNKTVFYVSSLIIVPVLFVLFYGVRFVGRVYAIDQWVPKWDTLLILATMIIVERIYTYNYAVSQRSVLARDVISNVVNLYVTGAVTGMIVLPILVFFPEHFWRRVFLRGPFDFRPILRQIAPSQCAHRPGFRQEGLAVRPASREPARVRHCKRRPQGRDCQIRD